jgi:prolyl-tRNA synthetase
VRWSATFIPTLREVPADAEAASHRLLLRAGYVRQLAAGVYSYLYLGQRTLRKIASIIREEMSAIGAQEMLLPALHPAELWQETGRWEELAATMFQFKDHAGRALCLGMTHEEVMTDLARRELRSYKQLPQIWFQIQTKFRDEPRPKSGLLRLRQFLMKDSYSFDLDEAGLAASYDKHQRAYRRIFDRCGLRYRVAEAHAGAMGGALSHEFAAVSDAGEDTVAFCDGCGYAASLERARSRPAPVEDDPRPLAPEAFATPGVRTIEELASFTGLRPEFFLKTLAYVSGDELVLALVRGDYELNEAKLSSALGGAAVRPAHPDEIRERLGAAPGFLGPVGAKAVRLVADDALRGRRNMITGANRDDTHLRNVTPGADFQAPFADLRTVRAGEGCPNCPGQLELARAIELGHIFQLGQRYARAMGARVLDATGKETTLWMGSYGIGLERILAAAVEQHHDADGLALPAAIAPFAVALTPTNLGDAAIAQAAEQLYTELRAAGIETLFDDRDERPGVKFKDADLVGIPWRITVGKKVQDGNVELRRRSTRDTRDATLSEVVAWLQASLEAA